MDSKEDVSMAHYLFHVVQTREQWAALMDHPEDRRQAIGGLLEQLGGRMLSFYYTFGEYDSIGIAELPDDVTAQAVVAAGMARGHLESIQATRLLTMEETLEALRKAREAPLPLPAGG